VTSALLWVAWAWAQTPTFNFALPPLGEQREVVAEASTLRFQDDATVAGPALKVGDKVEVILEVDGRVRFRMGTRYGWVAATALAEPGSATSAEVAPSGDAATP
jgi:hypothetical protein